MIVGPVMPLGVATGLTLKVRQILVPQAPTARTCTVPDTLPVHVAVILFVVDVPLIPVGNCHW